MSYPCVICDAILYETDTVATCSFCGQETPAEYLCPNGHYFCEECRLADLPQVVERVCEGTRETDPGLIVNLIMKHPIVVMHSPRHHVLVAPAMLAALANSGQRPLKPGRLESAIKRTGDIPFAVCGTRGECGGAGFHSDRGLVSQGQGAVAGPARYRRGAAGHRRGRRSPLLQTERLTVPGDGGRFPEARVGPGLAIDHPL